MTTSRIDPGTKTERSGTVPPDLDRIVLAGFMGSGKTTVGPLLARELAWTFVDLDEEIEQREKQTVPRIFAEEGEIYFRRVEAIALASLLGRKRLVLALGGGAPEAMGNKLLLEQTPRTAVIHLAAPFTILVERCSRQVGGTERPLLANLNTAEQRFDTRKKIYQSVADHTIDTSTLDSLETVQAVLRSLQQPRAV